MTRQSFRFILLLGFITENISASQIKAKSESFIKTTFATSVMLDFQKYSLPKSVKTKIQNQVKQGFFRDEVYLWKVTKGDSTLGYALLDNVIGKALPITFLVVFSPALKIKDVAIIKYRETVGGEIANRNWTGQFRDKNSISGFNIGSEIDGISGATMSVISVTKGVQKLTLLLSEIKDLL